MPRDLGADHRRQLVDRDGLVGRALGRQMTNAGPALGIEHGALQACDLDYTLEQ